MEEKERWHIFSFFFFPFRLFLKLTLLIFECLILEMSRRRDSPFEDEEVECLQCEVDEGSFGMSEETAKI